MTEESKSYTERQKENKFPLPYTLYKGVSGKFGALRITLKKAYTDERRGKNDGCVFIEAAPATGPNVYDWENSKILMALGIVDIGKVLLFLQNPNLAIFTKEGNQTLDLYHDRGAGTNETRKDVSTLKITKNPDKDSFFFTMTQKKENNNKQASIPVSIDEAVVMRNLLSSAIPHILSWN